MSKKPGAVRNTKNVLWDEKETAAYLGIEPQTLCAWRSTARFALPYIKVGRLVRYRPEDVEAFIESRTFGRE